jgi:hypothetical protein
MPNGRFEVDRRRLLQQGVTRLRADLIPLRDGALDQAEFTWAAGWACGPARSRTCPRRRSPTSPRSVAKDARQLARSWPAAVCWDYWNLPRVARLLRAQMAVRMGVLIVDELPKKPE